MDKEVNAFIPYKDEVAFDSICISNGLRHDIPSSTECNSYYSCVQLLHGRGDSLNVEIKNLQNEKNKNDSLNQVIGKLTVNIDNLKKENNKLKSANKQFSRQKKDKQLCQSKDSTQFKVTVDSLNKVIDTLEVQKDTLGDRIDTLNGQIRDLSKIEQQNTDSIRDLGDTIERLKTDLGKAQEPKNLPDYIGVYFNSVPFCGVLIALIIAITVISLKRGLTFSKGNTSICIGEKKRTRTKKVD
jgi:hypothetical protein